jgi:hypothetical protein
MFKKVRLLFVLILSVNLVSITAAQSGRVRSRESSSSPSAAVKPVTGAQNVIPKGTVIELRLNQSLSSKTNMKGEEFLAPIAEPVFVRDRLVLTPSTPVLCHIISVEPAKRNRNNGSLTIAFDEVVVDGQKVTLHATLVSIAQKSDEVLDEEREGKIKDPKKNKSAPVTIGSSAGIGATIGAIGGAPGGAIGGGAIGAGVGIGSILLSKGQDIELLSGTRLQIRLDNELKLPEQIGTQQKSK